MHPVWLKTLLQHGALIVACVAVAALYDQAFYGFVAALAILLAWHIYHLFLLEQWLRTDEAGPLPSGDGPWSQVLARIRALQVRAKESRRAWVGLVKEVRASTKAFPDGGVVLNEDLEIIRGNKAARRLLGLKKKRDRGTRIDNLIRHPEFVQYLKDGSQKSSVEIPAPGNNDTWLSCRVIPYGMGQRLLLVRDISQSVRLARTRRDFAANASHELRSPLTVISGYLDAMTEDDQMPATWHGPLTDMRAQAERMGRLVQDLLQLAKLESSESCSRARAVSVEQIVATAQREVLATVQRARRFETQIESNAEILGEATELQSIVTNLISNAVRYSPDDSVVEVSWRTNENGGWLTVRDEGIGINADDLPRLTERFYRTDAARARQESGTGLGLAIVKHALRRHNAELEVTSEVGEGSEFVCQFPPDRIAAGANVVQLAG